MYQHLEGELSSEIISAEAGLVLFQITSQLELYTSPPIVWLETLQ